MRKIIRLTESELINLVKMVIQENSHDERKKMGNFQDNKPSFIQRGIGKFKDFLTDRFNENDYNHLQKIKNIIKNPPFDGAVEIIRDNDEALMFRVTGRFVYIDKVNPTISIDHKELKVGERDEVESEISHVMGLLDI